MMLQFSCDGRPRPQPRPRVTSRGTFMPRDYADYRQELAACAQVAALELEQRGTPWDAMARRYRVRMKFFLAAETADLDKLEATVLDACEHAGLYASDRRVASIRSDRDIDRANPRVEVCVEVLG